MTDKPKILLLGGTADARKLAHLIDERFKGDIHIINSLAGRTKTPPLLPGETRVGGFGGALALEDYLKTNHIQAVIDATHPFAETISENAYSACLRANISRMTLARRPWKLPPGARWVEADDGADACDMLKQMATRVFLTVGRYQLQQFAALDDLFFLIRMIEKPDDFPDFKNHHLITARPPFDLETEQGLIEHFKINALVSKNSGGPVPDKILAAIRARIAIVLIKPPAPVPGPATTDMEDCLDCLKNLI